MDDNIKQIRTIAQDAEGSYYLSKLCNAADKLTESFGLISLTTLLNDLIYYVRNPKDASDADKETLFQMAENVLNFITLMSPIYESERDLYEYMKDKNMV